MCFRIGAHSMIPDQSAVVMTIQAHFRIEFAKIFFAKWYELGLLTSRIKAGVIKWWTAMGLGLRIGNGEVVIAWYFDGCMTWSLKLSQLLDWRPGTDPSEIALLALPTEAVPHHLTHLRHTLVLRSRCCRCLARVNLVWRINTTNIKNTAMSVINQLFTTTKSASTDKLGFLGV